ncbi:hypothetical protein JOQ06_013118 [Pogonophryne albipinna]|uniref:LRAT domain-containing protein n=1 Tax=Pogonophryne albipinna TaxID=1090488 RepID=A0AAD6BIG7_9TELE|nr:hypothetical protein JOQ06_013118 [Pogonophryne albipinna]
MLQLFTFLLEKFSLLFNFKLFGSSWSDGDNKVAHLIPDILPVLTLDRKLIGSVITNTRLIFGVICRCATVRVDTLEDFAYGSNILVNPMDKFMKEQALANEDVAKRAEKHIGASL